MRNAIAGWIGMAGALLLAVCRLGGGEAASRWPEASPQLMKEEVFGLRLRTVRETKGDQAGEQFLRQEFAKDPRTEVKAYMAWACFYGKGWGMPALLDPARGKELAEAAIQEGSVTARDVYGRALAHGLVPGAKLSESIRWLKEAAAEEVPRSLARLGYYTALGWNVPADPAAGLALARRAAGLGATDGLADIAKAHEDGKIGGKPDLDKALAIYAEGAMHRDDYAWKRLNELAKDNPRARLLVQIHQVREANLAVWMMPNKGRGLTRDLEALAGDDPAALVELGDSSLAGYYSKRDYAKAREFFNRAAAAGSEDAKFFLAKMQLRGWGEAKDPAAGLAVIRKMAVDGNGRAAGYLAHAHYWGAGEAPGVKKDEAAAFQYVKQAAEKGDVWALASLAFAFEHGIGTPENYAQAARFYWQAFLRGYHAGLEKTISQLKFVK